MSSLDGEKGPRQGRQPLHVCLCPQASPAPPPPARQHGERQQLQKPATNLLRMSSAMTAPRRKQSCDRTFANTGGPTRRRGPTCRRVCFPGVCFPSVRLCSKPTLEGIATQCTDATCPEGKHTQTSNYSQENTPNDLGTPAFQSGGIPAGSSRKDAALQSALSPAHGQPGVCSQGLCAPSLHTALGHAEQSRSRLRSLFQGSSELLKE